MKKNCFGVFPIFFQDENFQTCLPFYFPALKSFLERSKSVTNCAKSTLYNCDNHFKRFITIIITIIPIIQFLVLSPLAIVNFALGTRPTQQASGIWASAMKNIYPQGIQISTNIYQQDEIFLPKRLQLISDKVTNIYQKDFKYLPTR